MVGRPTKCTPEMIERVCNLLEDGINIKTTCELVGINQTSFCAWRNRGEAAIDEHGDNPEDIPDRELCYVKFLKRTRRARAKSKATSLKAIRDAGNKGNWKAHKWFLEHCFGQEFGKKQQVDVTTDGDAVTFTVKPPPTPDDDADD